ncbi:hypothetical protein KIH77_08570 [Bifidobacterium sp. 82T24]|uniref:hypothetical protein n=1 Tax=Bifidobacterium pluvialisilvae TaxID=2834436 RepID=UPI001C55C136|nr:hypothetical protein [Bifidobacterium pluvialisilvae]MBW3088779.1 hypothetical protein [Bifidobacterium pluvialisilvae]
MTGFDDEARHLLEALDAVDYVDERGHIHYTTAFAQHAVEEYYRGKGPKRIFVEAGFPVEIIGYKRIERALQRWRRLRDTPSCAS